GKPAFLYRVEADLQVGPYAECPLAHSLQVILLLTLVVAAAKLAGAAANRVRQPSVFGEILVGLILGPTLLNVLAWPVFASPANAAGVPLLDLVRDLAQVGVLLLMFVAGLETDLVMMRHVGKVAFWSAFGGVLLPMGLGAMTAAAFGLPLYWEGIFIGAILTATSVSISAHCARAKARRFSAPPSSTTSWASSCCRSSSRWPGRQAPASTGASSALSWCA